MPRLKPLRKSGFSYIPTFESLGFSPVGKSGVEAFGDCLFCGGRAKLYVNSETGLFNCKYCDEAGNVNQFLQLHIEEKLREYPIEGRRSDVVALNRDLPVSILLDAGLYYDGDSYGIPVKNTNGTIVNIRRFRLGEKLKIMGLPGMELQPFGLELLNEKTKAVVLCEGEWDALAFRQFILDNDIKGMAVLGVPGASVWKDAWFRYVEGKDVVIVYDNDGPGFRGLAKVFEAIGGNNLQNKHKIRVINWPDDLFPGFDFRDFYKSGGDWITFQEMLGDRPKAKVEGPGITVDPDEGDAPVLGGDRPTFQETLTTFKRWLLMTPEHEEALKVIFAVVLSNRMTGDPLWLHVIGPPGSGKTELLMSTAGCADVIVRSSITARSLISGHQGAKDASLIPRLIGNTFILKDFTEILDMPRTDRDQVYSVLRGAYDGCAMRDFGNGQFREYKGYFSMIAGVTHAIDGDADSTMGDRFLKFRLGTSSTFNRHEVIMESLKNVGKESAMKQEIQEMATRFLCLGLEGVEAPEVPQHLLEKIVALAELVSVLRTTVPRDTVHRDRVKFRPHPEMPTRIAKQLKRLLMGLSLERSPAKYMKSDYRLIAKVALDSCTPFQLEVIRYLAKEGEKTLTEISKGLNIPMTTLRECTDNMHLLGILDRQRDETARVGPPAFLWSVTPMVMERWEKAEVQ